MTNPSQPPAVYGRVLQTHELPCFPPGQPQRFQAAIPNNPQPSPVTYPGWVPGQPFSDGLHHPAVSPPVSNHPPHTVVPVHVVSTAWPGALLVPAANDLKPESDALLRVDILNPYLPFSVVESVVRNVLLRLAMLNLLGLIVGSIALSVFGSKHPRLYYSRGYFWLLTTVLFVLLALDCTIAYCVSHRRESFLTPNRDVASVLCCLGLSFGALCCIGLLSDFRIIVAAPLASTTILLAWLIWGCCAFTSFQGLAAWCSLLVVWVIVSIAIGFSWHSIYCHVFVFFAVVYVAYLLGRLRGLMKKDFRDRHIPIDQYWTIILIMLFDKGVPLSLKGSHAV